MVGSASPGQHSFSLFQEPWWLDAVAPNHWEEVRIEQNGEVLARWPFVVKRRYGVTALTQPPLTPSLGPWLLAGTGKYPTRLAREKELLFTLVDRLPKHDMMRATCAPEFTNWLPFFWRGFTIQPGCTYRIQNLTDEHAIWDTLSQTIRRAVRKVQSEMIVEIGEDVDSVISLNTKSLTRQNNRTLDGALVRSVFDACEKHANAKTIIAKNTRGSTRAGALLIWDSRIIYYLIGGLDTSHKDNQAMSLVLWEAIRLGGHVAKIFDFEGSMVESIEHFFRHFGGQQTTYMRLERYGRKIRVVRGLGAAASAMFSYPLSG